MWKTEHSLVLFFLLLPESPINRVLLGYLTNDLNNNRTQSNKFDTTQCTMGWISLMEHTLYTLTGYLIQKGEQICRCVSNQYGLRTFLFHGPSVYKKNKVFFFYYYYYYLIRTDHPEWKDTQSHLGSLSKKKKKKSALLSTVHENELEKPNYSKLVR